MGKEVSYGDDNYKKQLADFMQEINPKQLEKIEELIKQRLEAQKGR
jgi:hypothetical protein